jgi:hypothetical protein
MGAFTRAPFSMVAPILADFGYPPVPIRPGAKAPLIDDWQAGHPPSHYLPKCAEWGTGILTATCPAADLDIRDREVVRVLIGLAGEILGPTPFRVGAPPKALLPFSTATPFEKISGRWWALPGDDWRQADYSPHRIEILGAGQQYVAYARHPRGTFYRWRRGEPMDTHLVDLPQIDADQTQAFLATAEDVLTEAGAVPLRRHNKVWFPDIPQPAHDRRRSPADGPIDSRWQRFEPEVLARLIDPPRTVNGKRVGASRLSNGGFVCKCPAHSGERHRSLSITPRDGGGSIVHCFGGCEFVEIAREISAITGRRAI